MSNMAIAKKHYRNVNAPESRHTGVCQRRTISTHNPALQLSETDLHRTIARYLDIALPQNAFWFHVPNGGLRNAKTAKDLKTLGVKAGVPDIVIVWKGRFYGLELKTHQGKTSPAQKSCHQALAKAEATVCIARSLDEVYHKLVEWGIPVTAKPSI